MFLFFSRSISNPIVRLQRGVEVVVGKGNLGHKVGTKGKDEIAQLSRSFDNITENLKRVIASRDELNKEISERRKAEQRLQRAYTQLQQVQDQLVQAEKLNAVGRLASVIVHEVKNPLGVIKVSSGTIRRLAAGNRKIEDLSTFIEDEVERMNETILKILHFARPGEVVLKQTGVLDRAAVVAAVEELGEQ